MTKNKKFENIEITTYGYEGDEKYFEAFVAKLAQELKEGNEYFEYGGYIYEICCLWDDIYGTSYAIEKYNKLDCFETAQGTFIIDAPTRMYCGTVAAHVWRYKND